MNGLESANGRAVECQAVLKNALVEKRNRNGEVLHDAGQITEPHVDKLDVFVLREFEDVVGRLFPSQSAPLLGEIRGLTLGSRCCPSVNPMLRARYVTMPHAKSGRFGGGFYCGAMDRKIVSFLVAERTVRPPFRTRPSDYSDPGPRR